MDAIETKLLEALARAAVAEKVAERALMLAQDCLVKVEILRQIQVVAPAAPKLDMTLDPFVPEEKEPETQSRVSPFSLEFARRAPAQSLKDANAEAEKPLGDADMDAVREQIWDKEN